MTHGNKILALLMAFMLIIGMMPTSFAWSDDHPCAQGNHAWGPKEYFGDATCVEPASWVRECTVCGCQEDGEDLGSHSFGAWNTIQEGNCTQDRVERRSCQHCGETEERRTPGSGHSFGEWHVVTAPSCVKNGREEHVCSRCGYTEFRATDMVDHNMGEWYVFEEPQVGLPGIERRDCLNECGYLETREIPALEQDFDNVVINPGDVNLVPDENTNIYNPNGTEDLEGGDTNGSQNGDDVFVVITPGGDGELPDASLTLTMEPKYEYGPDNGTHYVLGECPWTNWNLHNNSDTVTMTMTEVRYYLNGSLYKYWENQINNRVLTPGADFADAASWYYISEEDIARGYVTVIIETDCIGDDGEMYYASAKLELPCGEGELPDDYVPPVDDDIDGDGIPNGDDPDVDGDGIPNGDDPDVDGDGVYLEKFIRNAPANGEYYVPGEVLNYALTLRIDDGLLLDDAAIYDPIIDNDGLVISDGKGLYGSMGMDVFYTVTEEDAQRGYVENTAYATWSYSDSGKAGYCESATVIAPCGEGEAPDQGDLGMTPALSITKEVVSTPANGEYFVPGEDIEFKISYANTGSVTLKDVALYDPLLSTGCIDTRDELAPGSEIQVKYATFYLSEIEAAMGGISNYAYVVGFDENGEMYVESSNIVNVPCGMTGGNDNMPENPFGVLTGLEVTKAVESLPLNGSYYTEGETVAYKITYTNSGETALTDVMIYDAMGGMTEIATAENLAPGESRICWFNHTVTKADVDAGYIANTAIGQYVILGYTNSVSSNTVIVDTDGDPNSTVPAEPDFVWGTLPGDKYNPGTGWDWTTVITPGTTPGTTPTAPTTPSFGTIDTDKLKGGDAYCVRTITGKDSASASYEISFCADHVDAQSSALLMNQAAAAPEMKLQAASYAVALWRAEVETLYQEILDAADSAAKATVMTEYIRFLTELANYEAMLNLLYPDQPALVAQMTAAKWEDKCVTLCYEIHAPAAERKDSLLNVTAATGTEATICSCEITAEENGKKAYTQNLCAAHSFPFSMIDALLKGQDTAEAWAMVRQIWGVELSSAYNKLSDKLGENSTLAAAEYNALTLWMAAREASLIALYPENPELVAQTMIKIIMDRVNELCAALQ